jgi:hypothetical protein
MAKAGTIREARSNVVKIAREVVAQAASGQVHDDTIKSLDVALASLDLRSDAANASRKAKAE